MLFGFLKNSMWPENEKKSIFRFHFRRWHFGAFSAKNDQKRLIVSNTGCYIKNFRNKNRVKPVIYRLYAGTPVTSKTILTVNQLVPFSILTVLIVRDNHAEINQKSLSVSDSFSSFLSMLTFIHDLSCIGKFIARSNEVKSGQEWSKVADYRK